MNLGEEKRDVMRKHHQAVVGVIRIEGSNQFNVTSKKHKDFKQALETICFRSIPKSNIKKPKNEGKAGESSDDDDDEEDGGDLSKYDLWGSDDDASSKEKSSNEKTTKRDERKRSTSKRKSRSRWSEITIFYYYWIKIKDSHKFCLDQDRIRQAVPVVVDHQDESREEAADHVHQDHRQVILGHDHVHDLIFDLEVDHVHVVENDKIFKNIRSEIRVNIQSS